MDVDESDDERPDAVDNEVRKKEMRKGIDLATTLERIEKNFVITDPRLPDNPIVRIFLLLLLVFLYLRLYHPMNLFLLKCQIFASDSFLELTEYSREEILGRNCRYLYIHASNSGTCVYNFFRSDFYGV